MSRDYWRRGRLSPHRNDQTWTRLRSDLRRAANFLASHHRELEVLTWLLALTALVALSLAADSGGR